MKLIDLNAPIIPWEGLGGIKLYSHINKLFGELEQIKETPILLGKYLIKYEIKDEVDLWFNIINGKLFKITALEKYTGKLFGKIKIGMQIDEVLGHEPSFVYNDFEEVYVSSKGIYIETCPVENTVLWISVLIKEIDNADFEQGNW